MTPLETEQLVQALCNLHADVVALVECIEEVEPDGGQAYDTTNTRRLLGDAWHAMQNVTPPPTPDPTPVLTPASRDRIHKMTLDNGSTIQGEPAENGPLVLGTIMSETIPDDIIEIVYLVNGDRIVMSMNGQVHAPLSLQDIANLLNKYHAMRNVAAEALDETENERDDEDNVYQACPDCRLSFFGPRGTLRCPECEAKEDDPDDDRQPTEQQEWDDGMRDAGMGTDESYGDFGGDRL